MTYDEHLKATLESRSKEIEGAIHRFLESGIALEQLSILHLDNGVTHLCVDGIPRFSWQVTFLYGEIRP